MGLRTLHLTIVPLVFALLSAKVAAAQEEAPGEPGSGGESRALPGPLSERPDLEPEARELLELREEMRKLRMERRDAMVRARDSGDPQAIERVREEYEPRMQALRERVRESRDELMDARLREHPELADRLAARATGGERFECGAGPGRASDDARRRAFRRLQVLARSTPLADPADIPTPVREELSAHARRVALLQCVRARARAKDDASVLERSRRALRAEQQRHDRALRELLGAQTAPAQQPTPATPAGPDETTSPREGAAPARSAEEGER